MANKLDNLKRGNPATQFKSGRRAVEAANKSAEVRRENSKGKSDLRVAAQTVLDGTYKCKDKTTGKVTERTGAEMLVLNVLAIGADPKNKQCIAAIKLLMELTGANKSEESKAVEKATAALIQAKADLLSGSDTTTLDKLDDILKEMRDNADTKS